MKMAMAEKKYASLSTETHHFLAETHNEDLTSAYSHWVRLLHYFIRFFIYTVYATVARLISDCL